MGAETEAVNLAGSLNPQGSDPIFASTFRPFDGRCGFHYRSASEATY